MSFQVSGGFFAPTFLLVWMFLQGASTGFAASVKLAWDPNREPDVVGYRLYWGTAIGRYDQSKEVGLVTQGTVEGLTEGATYYFSATARNAAGLESRPSAEIAYLVPASSGGGGGGGGGGVEIGEAPTASDTSVELAEDSEVEVFLAASSVSGGALTYTITLPPQNGTLSGVPPNLMYRPRRDFYGQDAFEFRVNDGALDSLVAYVEILVTPVNDAPVAANLTVSVQEDGGASATLRAIDAEGAPVSFSILRPPANGKLEGTLPNLFYRPASNYSGTDFLEYIANDGSLNSAIGRISFVVSPVEDPPAAIGQSLSILSDAKLNLVLNGVDPEGGALSYSIVRPPSKGVLTGIPPLVLYVPALLSQGTDSFDFRVTDSAGLSSIATVQLSISPVILAPTASPLSVAVFEDWTTSITLRGTDPLGANLRFAITSPPRHGVITGTPPNVSYQPSQDFFGADSFDYTVSDGARTSEPARVSIAVSSVNDLPVANGQSIEVSEDSEVPITLTGNDVETRSIAFSIATPPTHGTLSGTPPFVVYRPRAGYFGSDRFEFRVTDQSGGSGLGTVTVAVVAKNGAPSAQALVVSIPKNGSTPILLKGSDPEGAALTFTVSSLPAHGALTGIPPNLVYQPAANFVGSDLFRYTVSDGSLSSAAALVSITVTNVYTPPTAASQSLATAEDTALPIALTGSGGGEPLTYVVSRPPTNGVLTGVPPSLTYTPNAHFAGADSFEFTVQDGTAASAAGLVSISVTPVNDPPSAAAQSLTMAEDTSRLIRLIGSDADGEVLAYTIGRAPAQGTLSGTPPNVTYTPRANYAGTDSFEFTVRDAVSASAPAVVSILVTPVNDSPSASPQSMTIAENTSRSFRLVGIDVDGDTLAYTIVRPPAQGTLSGAPPNVTYTPKADFSGTDSFEFSVRDAVSASAAVAVSIVVTDVNSLPAASPQSVSLAEDSPRLIQLIGTDADGDTLAYAIVRPPAQGTLSGTPPNVTYTPRANFSGTDSFEFSVRDAIGASAPALVSISVTPVNDLPSATAQSLTVAEDSSQSIRLIGIDADGDTLAYAIVRPPAQGTLSGTPPNVTYAPRANFFGSDSFEFTVRDGATASAPATVSVTVTPVNDSPTALAQSLSVVEDTVVTVLLAGQDAEGDSLGYSIVRAPLQGTLAGTPPNLTYTPRTNYFGTDSFEFSVRDGTAASAAVVVTLVVTPAEDAPSGVPGSVGGQEDTSIPVVLAGSDGDGDTLSYAVVVSPRSGVLTGTAPNLTYRPDANFAGEDSLQFTVSDGKGVSAPALVTVTVTPVNDAPTASSQSLTLSQGSPLVIRLTGQDVDGDTLAYSIARSPLNGTIAGAPPNVTYTPNVGFAGEDFFEFLVRDRTLASVPGRVALTVIAVNRAPVATAGTVSGLEDSSIPITLIGSDADGDALTYAVVGAPQQGTISGVAPNLVYRPENNFFGTDAIQFTVSDGTLTSASATLTIQVAPVNDAPTANGQSVVTGYGMPVSLTLTGSDPEGSPLTYRVLTAPANGTLSGTMPNPVYTPRAGYSGMDSFTVVASDGTLESASATIQIRISLILLASNRGAVVPISGDSSGDALAVGGDSGDRMVGTTSTTTGGDPVEWLSLPTHGMVDASQAGEVSYEPALDGSTLDSFSFRINGEGGPSEPMVVALHLVGFQEVKRLKGEVQVTFPTIAGLTYRVEWNDASPSAASNWQVWETLTPADPGIVSVRVANPPDGVFRFIRLTCEGTENQVVSEPWGVSSASVVGGMDGRVYSVPFQGPIRLRGRVQSVTGSSIEIEAGTTEVPSLEPVVGQVTHALTVRSSKLDARSAGAWWAITGQSNQGIQVEEGIESLAECLRAGDEVEIVRLLTVAEVFGKASSPEIQLSDGDRLSISGLGGVDYLIEYRISNRGGASYWIVQGDTLAGPFDGTTLPLPPFPTFHFVDRVSPGSVVLVGRVQDGPAVQYLHPGARMVGNAFPVAMEVPELSPYRLEPGDYPWLESGLGTAPEICPPWASNTGGIGAGAGLWIRIPEEAGVLRWVQQCPWPMP